MNEIATQESRGMAPYLQAITSAEKGFNSQSFGQVMNFEEEKGHAVELLFKNRKAMEAAQANPHFVRRAVVKIASIGLSLNPALSYAYLVPRYDKNIGGKHICLDISWKGLLKLATDSGAIKRGKAETVKENDVFEYNGMYEMPTHKVVYPFDEEKRGKTVGFYCVAITDDGGYICDFMSKSDVDDIRETSMAKNAMAWTDYYDEMGKKSIIKRAQKQWPKGNDNRLENAIQHLNEHEGLKPSGDEVDPDDFQLSGDLIDPFFEAYYTENSWLLYEVKDRATDEQWPMLLDMFRKDLKDLTARKKKAKELVWNAQAQFVDLVEALRQNKADGHEDGMIEDLVKDIPSEYWRERLRKVE